MSSYLPTQSEASRILNRYGITLRHRNGEFEVFPARKRGNSSYFATDIVDAMATGKAMAIDAFKAKLAPLPLHGEINAALVEWYKTHGKNWREELWSAWTNGNYGVHAHTNVSSYLQRFRNTTGHEIVATL